jgi:hypothetical protein
MLDEENNCSFELAKYKILYLSYGNVWSSN